MPASPETTATALKPCPFCGGEAESRYCTGLGWDVCCCNCGNKTRWVDRPGKSDAEDDAVGVAAWNRRAA